MAEIRAFRALRYTDKGGDIAKNVCPPYDIISESERRALLAQSPTNIVRLELPRGERPYEEAAQALRRLEEENVLSPDAQKGLYIYEEEFTVRGVKNRIKGLYALVKLHEFSDGVVLPHEETLSKAKADRFELMSATMCNFSAIYSMYVDETHAIRRRMDALSAGKPDVEFVAADGVVQRLWCVYDTDEIAFFENAFSDKKLYIADGHHRYETALNFKKKLIADGVIKNDSHKGNYCMMMLADIDHEGLVVFPTHRLVRDLEGFDKAAFLTDMKEYFDVRKLGSPKELTDVMEKPQDGCVFGYCDGDGAYLLKKKETPEVDKALCEALPGKSGAYRGLDVAVLHSLILEKLLGIDKENMANQRNLTYTRDADEAIRGVESGAYACCFLLEPTRVRQIKDVAAAGEKMPQKSTYFYPKLITGLVMNKLTDEE